MKRLHLSLVMILWGSLGVFTKSIPLSALSLAFLRAFIALPVLFLAMKVKTGVHKKSVLSFRQLKPYLLSGAILGFGWLTLFYGFKHTSIASAVIIYNMCPVYVIIAAPLLLKEKIMPLQIAVIIISFTGLLFIVGSNLTEGSSLVGILLSGLSGIMYACIVMLNRSIKERVENRTATFFQILTAALVLLPFVLIDGEIFRITGMDIKAWIFLVLLGAVHTGLAYTLFFSVYESMKSLEIVSFSYLEPLFAIVFSLIFLGETLMPLQIAGGVMILGSTYAAELIKYRRSRAGICNSGVD